MSGHARSKLLFFLVTVLVAACLARAFVRRPSYTDAFYHFNVAVRLARGGGFVEDTLWAYLDAPATLPAPSHRYWMPLTSILAALGMAAFDAPGDYAAAQSPFILLTAGAALAAFQFTVSLGGTLRQAWIAGLLTAFGGFFAPRWGAVDTFAPYALIASLALLCAGKALAASCGQWRLWILAGVLAGLAHLTRPDGALVLLTVCCLALTHACRREARRKQQHERLLRLPFVTVPYLLAMCPWFLRNSHELGAALPTAGLESVFFSEYDDLFRYTPAAPLDALGGSQILRLLEIRWSAAVNGLVTFIAVEGMIVLAPFMLIGWWRFRRHPLLRGFVILAIAIHVFMILLFPLQGSRGGLFHAIAALFPICMALGVLGLDSAVEWAARRRCSWNAAQAKTVFALAALVFGIGISLAIALPARSPERGHLPPLYAGLRVVLPAGARVMINDPAQLYFHLGHGGVTIPNDSVHFAREIANRYDIQFLVLEQVAGGRIGAAPARFQFDVDSPPAFLRPLPFDARGDARLYEILSD